MTTTSQSDERPLATYAGPVSQVVVTALVQAVENRLERSLLQRRVIEAVIEMGQNILHHGKANGDAPAGEIVVFRRDEGCRIAAANAVAPEEIDSLRSCLARLETLTCEAARDERLRKRSEPVDELSAGAGLGLLLLRERSSEFKYNLQKMDQNTYWFCLSVVLQNSGVVTDEKPET